jgi:hypothetical protein
MGVDHYAAQLMDCLNKRLHRQGAPDELFVALLGNRLADARRIQVADVGSWPQFGGVPKKERLGIEPVQILVRDLRTRFRDVTQAIGAGLQGRIGQAGLHGGFRIVLSVNVIVAAVPAALLRGEPAV